MPPSGVDYASEFLNGYAPEYVPIPLIKDCTSVMSAIYQNVFYRNEASFQLRGLVQSVQNSGRISLRIRIENQKIAVLYRLFCEYRV